MSYGWMLGLGLFLAVSAGLVFYWTWSQYERVSGHALGIAILRTIAFVVIIGAIGAIAWWGSALLFAPGRWRYTALFLGFTVLESTLGWGAMYLATAVIERWFHP